MKRTKERGSVVGFVIVGVLLAAVAIGGIYALNRYNSSQAGDASNTDTNESSTSTDNSTETSTPPAETNNQPAVQPQTTQTNQADEESAGLPQTGPVDTVVTMLAAVVLAVGITAYIRSRRAIASL